MDLPFNSVCVVGMGYIGLPTATVLAAHGFTVVGIDVREEAVAAINSGRAHIVEPDLDTAVTGAVAAGRLRASTTVEPADAFIVAVPTPFRDEKIPDLSFVEAAARAIAPVLRPGNLIILESTSPPGTTQKMASWIAAERPDLTLPGTDGEPDLAIAYCPERVLPGRILIELVTNDRVIGGLDQRSAELARDLYRVFVQGECVVTEARTAELVKLSENAFRDVNIAFANELSLICGQLGADVWDVIALANRHPRVEILRPGPGVGGHCISVDPWFLVDAAPEAARLIATARAVNDSKPHHVVDQVLAALEVSPEARVACLGLAFKADIDDLRESPAVEITAALLDHLGDLLVVEPHVDELPPALAGAKLVDLETALDADVLVLLVDHTAFRDVDRDLLAARTVVDTRGIWR